MAKQMIIVRGAKVLEMFLNEYTDKKTGELKRFDSVFIFQSSTFSGGKPRVIEARVHSMDQAKQLQSLEGKELDLCFEETTWKDGTVLEFFCTLAELVKSALPSAPPVTAVPPQAKAAAG
ncbi:MAG: hypothetical protein NDI73_00045 [Desulfuromonadales bacterium]|nr:hypothetical protein [Desulfuromonadales bacterium]